MIGCARTQWRGTAGGYLHLARLSDVELKCSGSLEGEFILFIRLREALACAFLVGSESDLDLPEM